jgi:hypothetical protein
LCLVAAEKLLDESVAEGLGDGLGFGVDLEFLVDFLQVKGNGLDADAQFRRRRFVAVAFSQQIQNPQLMRR